MCSSHDIKSEPADTKLTLPEIGRGRPSSRAGANARWSSPGTPETEAPSPLPQPRTLEPRKRESEFEFEDEDLFAGLSRLFDGFQIDDADDSESEPEDAPPSPAAKGIDPSYFAGRNRTYFYATGRLYFFDDERNVYLDNSPGEVTLRHVGKPFMLEESGMFNPDFFIDGVPYYFDGINNALLYEEQGTYRNVYTWAGESDTNTFNEAFNPTFVPRTTTGGVFQSNNIGFDYSGPTYYEETKQVPWSPDSSTLSPIVSSGSRASSVGVEPLIQPGYGSVMALWDTETKKAQAERAPPPNKADRRRCPICTKVFRRPSSLDDHLNVHSGEKPHICPFPNCKTGFATKSNMKRHFQTHRVGGSVEEYAKNVGKIGKVKSQARTTTYNSKAFHTQRFRLTA